MSTRPGKNKRAKTVQPRGRWMGHMETILSRITTWYEKALEITQPPTILAARAVRITGGVTVRLLGRET
jgi:hypothetical protein